MIEAIQGGTGQHRGGAAAAAADDEEDPLEAFMKANESSVTKEKEKAEAHQRAWDAQYAGKHVEICPRSRPHLAYISRISRLYLAHISPISRRQGRRDLRENRGGEEHELALLHLQDVGAHQG